MYEIGESYRVSYNLRYCGELYMISVADIMTRDDQDYRSYNIKPGTILMYLGKFSYKPHMHMEDRTHHKWLYRDKLISHHVSYTAFIFEKV